MAQNKDLDHWSSIGLYLEQWESSYVAWDTLSWHFHFRRQCSVTGWSCRQRIMLELWVCALEEPGRLGIRRLAHKYSRPHCLWWPHTGYSPSTHPSTAACISYGTFLSGNIFTNTSGWTTTVGNEVEVPTVLSEQNMLTRTLICIISECR